MRPMPVFGQVAGSGRADLAMGASPRATFALYRTSQALARLLQAAGVRFAILGPEERCTGDAARRLGNEYLYQALAAQCVETFKTYEVTKIITQCPHCFSTISIKATRCPNCTSQL